MAKQNNILEDVKIIKGKIDIAADNSEGVAQNRLVLTIDIRDIKDAAEWTTIYKNVLGVVAFQGETTDQGMLQGMRLKRSCHHI